MTLIGIGEFGTIFKGIVKRLEDLEKRRQGETFQTTNFLRSARILKRVLETCCHSNCSGKPSANCLCERSMLMTLLSLTNIFLRMCIIFTLYTTAFGRWSELCNLLGKSCPIIRKFKYTKSPLERINLVLLYIDL